MLIIPHTIAERELRAVKRYFSLADIRKYARRIKDGIGIFISALPDDTKLVKIDLTSRTMAGRALFVLQTRDGIVMPVIVRTKHDKLGKNLSKGNAQFERVVEANIALMHDDLLHDRFDMYEL